MSSFYKRLLSAPPVQCYMATPENPFYTIQFEIAVKRNQQVYRQLYLDWHKPLIAFSTTITASYESSEEIFSDVFMRLWNMRDALLNVENLKVYLYKAMKNASLNYLAKARRVSFVDIDSLPENYTSTATPENVLLNQELKSKLSTAVASLPPKCGLVFRLIKEENLSYKQVAEILEISVNTIEGHMTTALKKLSDSMKRYQ